MAASPSLRRLGWQLRLPWARRLRFREECADGRRGDPGRRHRQLQQPRPDAGRALAAADRWHRRAARLRRRQWFPPRLRGIQRHQHVLASGGWRRRAVDGRGARVPRAAGGGARPAHRQRHQARRLPRRHRQVPAARRRRPGRTAEPVRSGQGLGAHQRAEPGFGGRLDDRQRDAGTRRRRLRLSRHRGAGRGKPPGHRADLGRAAGGYAGAADAERPGLVGGQGRRLPRDAARGLRQRGLSIQPRQRRVAHPAQSDRRPLSLEGGAEVRAGADAPRRAGMDDHPRPVYAQALRCRRRRERGRVRRRTVRRQSDRLHRRLRRGRHDAARRLPQRQRRARHAEQLRAHRADSAEGQHRHPRGRLGAPPDPGERRPHRHRRSRRWRGTDRAAVVPRFRRSGEPALVLHRDGVERKRRIGFGGGRGRGVRCRVSGGGECPRQRRLRRRNRVARRSRCRGVRPAAGHAGAGRAAIRARPDRRPAAGVPAAAAERSTALHLVCVDGAANRRIPLRHRAERARRFRRRDPAGRLRGAPRRRAGIADQLQRQIGRRHVVPGAARPGLPHPLEHPRLQPAASRGPLRCDHLRGRRGREPPPRGGAAVACLGRRRPPEQRRFPVRRAPRRGERFDERQQSRRNGGARRGVVPPRGHHMASLDGAGLRRLDVQREPQPAQCRGVRRRRRRRPALGLRPARAVGGVPRARRTGIQHRGRRRGRLPLGQRLRLGLGARAAALLRQRRRGNRRAAAGVAGRPPCLGGRFRRDDSGARRTAGVGNAHCLVALDRTRGRRLHLADGHRVDCAAALRLLRRIHRGLGLGGVQRRRRNVRPGVVPGARRPALSAVRGLAHRRRVRGCERHVSTSLRLGPSARQRPFRQRRRPCRRRRRRARLQRVRHGGKRRAHRRPRRCVHVVDLGSACRGVVPLLLGRRGRRGKRRHLGRVPGRRRRHGRSRRGRQRPPGRRHDGCVAAHRSRRALRHSHRQRRRGRRLCADLEPGWAAGLAALLGADSRWRGRFGRARAEPVGAERLGVQRRRQPALRHHRLRLADLPAQRWRRRS